MIDQTLLPTEYKEIECRSVETVVWEAIKRFSVRGCTRDWDRSCLWSGAGFANGRRVTSRAEFDQRLKTVADYLAGSRPTAVNLFWALDRLQKLAADSEDLANSGEIHQRFLEEALRIEVEDLEMCHKIGEVGASCFPR